MLRHLLLSFVLLTNTSFAQRAALNSSGFESTDSLLTNGSFVQQAALNSSGFDPTYKLTLRNAVQDKNFYLLSLFQRHPEVRKLLTRNQALKKLANDKLQALRMAANCHDPLYKEIDKVSFDVSSEDYRKLLKVKIAEIRLSENPLFFEPTLNFALKLLEAN